MAVKNSYQSTNRAMRPEEMPSELRERIVSRFRSKTGYKILLHRSTQEHSGLYQCKKSGTSRTPKELCNPGGGENGLGHGYYLFRKNRDICSPGLVLAACSLHPDRTFSRLLSGNYCVIGEKVWVGMVCAEKWKWKSGHWPRHEKRESSFKPYKDTQMGNNS